MDEIEIDEYEDFLVDEYEEEYHPGDVVAVMDCPSRPVHNGYIGVVSSVDPDRVRPFKVIVGPEGIWCSDIRRLTKDELLMYQLGKNYVGVSVEPVYDVFG